MGVIWSVSQVCDDEPKQFFVFFGTKTVHDRKKEAYRSKSKKYKKSKNEYRYLILPYARFSSSTMTLQQLQIQKVSISF